MKQQTSDTTGGQDNHGHQHSHHAHDNHGEDSHLHAVPKHAVKQEIGSFVYRARKPFHPQRLFNFLEQHFILQQPSSSEPDSKPAAAILAACKAAEKAAKAASKEASRLASADAPTAGLAASTAKAAAAAAAAATAASLAATKFLENAAPALDLEPSAAASAKQAADKRQSLYKDYGQLLRSKGFVWVATRPNHCGEWSQAGGIARLGTGGPWFCVLPEVGLGLGSGRLAAARWMECCWQCFILFCQI